MQPRLLAASRLGQLKWSVPVLALVAVAGGFAYRDFETSMDAAIGRLRRDAEIVAHLSVERRADGRLERRDTRSIAGIASSYAKESGGRLVITDASGRVLYSSGARPAPSMVEDLPPSGPREVHSDNGDVLEVVAPFPSGLRGRSLGAVRLSISLTELRAKVFAESRNRYAGFGTATLVLILGLLLVVEFFLRRSSRLQRLMSESRHQALHDGLTGLPNRSLFRDRAVQALKRSRRQGGDVAIMIMDLDRFKEVNDTLGHHHGDLLLQEIAARLTGSLREVDTVARLGGDEFGVLLTDLSSTEDIEDVVSKILAAVRRPLILDGFTLSVDVSIGAAVSPRHGDDFDTLVKRADVAMYEAKTAGTGYELYEARKDRHSAGKLTLAHDFKSAIERGQLELHYQPQIDIATQQVGAVEALVRWNHPARGVLQPREFIPLAENTGLIKQMSRWVLNEALRQNSVWRSQGLDLGVAVNLSARDLVDPKTVEEVAQQLRRWGVPAHRLELEITESAVMADPTATIAVLERLSALGVRLSIDDFGTGYSSLSYLQRLPVTGVKIDKTFVTGMRTSTPGFVIVRSTIEIARSLGLHTVAEGVEDQEVWDTLAGLGCDAVQGFLRARPSPPEQIPWLVSLLRPARTADEELDDLLLGAAPAAD